MQLYELAFACRAYGALTGYDASLKKLRKATGRSTPIIQIISKPLFKWLNDWGCRQFSTAHHFTVAAPSLVAWASTWLTRLPPDDLSLDAIDQVQVAHIGEAYGDLRSRRAGMRSQRSGSISDVEYGPVGAAKTLFALRPSLCPPWDNSTLSRLGFDGSAVSYCNYLWLVLSQLRTVAIQAGVEISELPALVRRRECTPPKLIDEYYWVTITNGFNPPTREELATWLAWANLDPASSTPD